jgi:hypothetical protein
MKKQSSKTEKNLWAEFLEYLASVYQPEAEDYLPSELVQWEYKRFLEVMAR